MKSQRILLVLVPSIILLILSLTSTVYAGSAVRLEKDVPRIEVPVAPNTVTFNLFDSETASTPVASQTFLRGEWSADYNFSKFTTSAQDMVRFKVNFSNTDSLTRGMDLWVEIELDGMVKGERKQVKKEVWALFSGKYANVAIVSPSGGDYTDPLTAMSGVSSWCGTPSDTNPCLLKLMPGVYNIGSGSIQMQSYVDIEGSGENTTRIIGNIEDDNSGVVNGASNAEIRLLTTEHYTTGSNKRNFGIYNSGSSPTISYVTVIVSGSTNVNRGIANYNNSAPLIRNVTIKAFGIHSCGVINSDSSLTIENTTVYVSQVPSLGYYISGIESLGDCSLTIRDTTVDVSGGTDAIGILLRYGSASISNTSVSVYGGSVANKGILLNVGAVSPYNVTVDNSRIHGDTYSIDNGENYTTKIGASKLEGPLRNFAGGTIVCAGVYNANYQFFANTCP